MSNPTVETQIADFVKPGVLVVWYMSDGSTCRSRYPAGTIEDVETTLSLAKRTGKLIQVDSWDSDDDSDFAIYLVPRQVVRVKIQKAGDLPGAVS